MLAKYCATTNEKIKRNSYKLCDMIISKSDELTKKVYETED